MRVIALETSDRIGSLAALQADEQWAAVLAQKQLPDDQRSARSLVPEIQSLLRECGWKPNQLELIAVATGPGSFTGLRIGVTTAKTLAYATGAKLVEVHTLSALAGGVPAAYERLWTILDAQRNQLFAAHFQPDQLESMPATEIVGIPEFLNGLRSGDTVVGPPLQRLSDQLPVGVQIVDSSQWYPRAEIVGQLGIAAHRAGRVVNAMQLVPRYYRKSAAEEKAEGDNGGKT